MFNTFLLKIKNSSKFNLIINLNTKIIKYLLFILGCLFFSYLYLQVLFTFCAKSSILVGNFSFENSLLLFLPEILILVYILCSFINYLLKGCRLYSEVNYCYIKKIILKFHTLFFFSSLLILVRWGIFSDYVLFIFNFSLVIDSLSSFFKIYILIITCFILNSLEQNFKNKNIVRWEVLYLLVLCSFLLIILLSATDLLLIFLLLSFISLSLYAILYASSTSLGYNSSSVLKYFFLNSLAAGMFLFSIFFLLLSYKTTNSFNVSFTNINVYLNEINILPDNKLILEQAQLLFSILICLAMLFKIGAFPGSFYVVDLYKQMSYTILAYVVSCIKIIFFVVFIKIIVLFCSTDNYVLKYLLIFSSLLSIISGTLGAVYARKVKTFIALASINQTGFVMLAMINSFNISSIGNGFIFLFIYGITMLTILLHLSAQTNIVYLTDFHNLKSSFLIRIIISICWLSLAGFPPFLGFLLKYQILYNILMYPFIIFIVLLFSLISWYYYLKIIILLWSNEDFHNFYNFKSSYLNYKGLYFSSFISLLFITPLWIFYFNILHSWVGSWIIQLLFPCQTW